MTSFAPLSHQGPFLRSSTVRSQVSGVGLCFGSSLTQTSTQRSLPGWKSTELAAIIHPQNRLSPHHLALCGSAKGLSFVGLTSTWTTELSSPCLHNVLHTSTVSNRRSKNPILTAWPVAPQFSCSSGTCELIPSSKGSSISQRAAG